MPAKKSTEKKIKEKLEDCCGKCGKGERGMGCAYFLGFIGAVIYNLQASTGFWSGVLGFLKALVWPAFLVYELFKFLGM